MLQWINGGTANAAHHEPSKSIARSHEKYSRTKTRLVDVIRHWKCHGELFCAEQCDEYDIGSVGVYITGAPNVSHPMRLRFIEAAKNVTKHTHKRCVFVSLIFPQKDD